MLDLPLDAGRFEEIADVVFDLARAEAGHYVCAANVHMFTLARRNRDLANAIEHASVVTSDGMPLVWALRRKGIINVDRVYGPDLMEALCKRAAADATPVYLFGGTSETLERLRLNLTFRNPTLRIAGAEAPPKLTEKPAFDASAITRIRDSGARIVFVGLGCPKQEYWMETHARQAGALCVGVGAAFDFLAGMVPQAPVWMQRTGLEWLFRLASEPRRLFKRYLVSNSAFIYYFLTGRL